MTTCGNAERDVEVQVWLEDGTFLTAEDSDTAVVVQIDTGERTGRIRVNLNDGEVWDGDPFHDDAPGRHARLGVEMMNLGRAVAVAEKGDIDSEVAAHMLNAFGRGGYAPGTFTEHLIEAMMRADPENFRLISIGFPEYAYAMILGKQHPAGIDILKGIAHGVAK